MTRTNRERITFFLVTERRFFPNAGESTLYTQTSILGRVVKAMDLSPIGQCPREFEPRRMQLLFFLVALCFCLCVCTCCDGEGDGKKQKRVFEPRIELGTFCVLGRRDNQLHHPNATDNCVYERSSVL